MRFKHMYVAVGLALGLAACGQGTEVSGPEVLVSGPPTVVNLTELTPPTSPTALRGPTTITLNDLQMGQTLYPAVGDTFKLDESVSGPAHLRDDRMVAPVPDASGVYKALTTGQMDLEVVVDPCAGWNQPAPSR